MCLLDGTHTMWARAIVHIPTNMECVDPFPHSWKVCKKCCHFNGKHVKVTKLKNCRKPPLVIHPPHLCSDLSLQLLNFLCFTALAVQMIADDVFKLSLLFCSFSDTNFHSSFSFFHHLTSQFHWKHVSSWSLN